MIERSTRCTIVVGVAERDLSPSRARRWYSSTARSTSARTSASCRSGCEPAALDTRDHVVPDDVVRVGAAGHRTPRRHDATSSRTSAARRGSADDVSRDALDTAREPAARDRRPGPRRVGDARVEPDERDVDGVDARA